MNIKKLKKSVNAMLIKIDKIDLHVSDYEWLKRQLKYMSRQIDSQKPSVLPSIISESEVEQIREGRTASCDRCNDTGLVKNTVYYNLKCDCGIHG